MTGEKFTEFITSTIQDLPLKIKEYLDNVAFVVESAPRPATIHEQLIQRNHVLLGLYQGIPLTRRNHGYSGVLPDKITIFQQMIERVAGPDESRIGALIRDVVLHEVAHHLGFSERQVRAWEQKRKKA